MNTCYILFKEKLSNIMYEIVDEKVEVNEIDSGNQDFEK